MSPATRTRNPITRRACPVLAVRALGTLLAVVSRCPARFPAIPATLLAASRLRPAAGGCGQLPGSYVQVSRRAHPVITTPGPLTSGYPTAAQVRPARTRALTDRLTLCTINSQRRQRYVTHGITGRPAAQPPSLRVSSFQPNSLRGQHLRMIVPSGR